MILTYPLANNTNVPKSTALSRGSAQYRHETETEAHWFSCHHVTISASLQLTSGNICVFYYGGNWMVEEVDHTSLALPASRQ